MKINCCPKCGGTIYVSSSDMWRSPIGRRGKLLRSKKDPYDGPLIQMLACCENYINQGCNVNWNSEEFSIDANGYFVDFKYTR